MLRLLVLLCCSLAIKAQLVPPEEAHPAPEPYSFAYSSPNEDGSSSSREEIGDANGRITGFYTLLGADGQQRRVEYVADENGFRASVTTNEIGTESKNAADAEYLSSAPTAAELVAAYEASGAGKARLEAQALRQAAIRTGAVGLVSPLQKGITASRIAQTAGLVSVPGPIAPIAPIAPIVPVGGGYSRFQNIRTTGGFGRGLGLQFVGEAPIGGAVQGFQSLRTQTLGNLGGIRFGGIVQSPALQTIQTAGLADLQGLQGLQGLNLKAIQDGGANLVVLPGNAIGQNDNTVLRFVTGSAGLQPLRLNGLQSLQNVVSQKLLVPEAVEVSKKS